MVNQQPRDIDPSQGQSPKQGPSLSLIILFGPLLIIAGVLIQALGVSPVFNLPRPTPAESATTAMVGIPEAVALPEIETPRPAAPVVELIATREPTARPTPVPTRESVKAHLSWYWPPFGDINCDYECEHIANGDDWKTWVGKGLACPMQYPLGTVFVVMGEEWTCVDRGEAIVVNQDGTIWLDLLVSGMPYGIPWGSVRTVEVRK